MERTLVRVVARFPAEARGALVDGALVAIMAETMTRMTGLMVAGMGRWKRNLGITSGPPRLESLEDSFRFRRNGGG